MDGGDDTWRSLYRLLSDRFQNLEASHHELKEQFQLLRQENTRNNIVSDVKTFQEKEEMTSDSEHLMSFPGWGYLPEACVLGSPYRSVLEHMGHAVHVTRTGSGEIIYWNRAAEELYGYKYYEAVGHSVVQLLFDEEHHPAVHAIMEGLTTTGESWSGQLPLKKRSGRIFVALVSKSLLYEDGKPVGVVTVSSDASVFNNTSNSRNNLKKIKWRPQPQVLKPEDVTCDRERVEGEVERKADKPPRVPIAKHAFGSSIGRNINEGMISEGEESTSVFVQPPKIVSSSTKTHVKVAARRKSTPQRKSWMKIFNKLNGLEDNQKRDATESTCHVCNHESSSRHRGT